jgi:hypothetical protein
MVTAACPDCGVLEVCRINDSYVLNDGLQVRTAEDYGAKVRALSHPCGKNTINVVGHLVKQPRYRTRVFA